MSTMLYVFYASVIEETTNTLKQEHLEIFLYNL